jgi:hypothetical protein
MEATHMKTAALGLILTALPGVAAADWDRPAPAYPGYNQPPPVVEETRPPCPSAQHTWVEGRWEYNQYGQRVYRQGYWQAPAQYEPQYEPQQQVAAEVWVGTPPPAPQYEVRPRPPFAAAVWIPGYWRWGGHRHQWVSGYWTSPRAGYAWQAGGWHRSGNRWGYSRGYWRRGRW